MYDPSVLVVWQIVFNAYVLGLILFFIKAVPSSEIKGSLFFFMLSYSIWTNSLFLVQLLGESSPYSRLCSQFIFSSGALVVASFGNFLLLFSNKKLHRSLLNRILFFMLLVFAALSFSGIFEDGVKFSEGAGLKPITNGYTNYYNLLLVGYGVYFLVGSLISYLKSSERLLKLQLGKIYLVSLPSFGIAICTNAVIPEFTGDYSLTPLGGFWFIMFFTGVTYILVAGKSLVLFDSISKVSRFSAKRKDYCFGQIELVFNELIKETLVHARPHNGRKSKVALPWKTAPPVTSPKVDGSFLIQ